MDSGDSPILGVVDIGTNSVKLLVGRYDGRRVHAIHFDRATTRLGRDLENERWIGDDEIDATAVALARFANDARRHGADDVFAFSTWVMRRARNADDVRRAFHARCGVDVRVVSGRSEARFAYLSARQALERPKPSILAVDVGGGSTECVLGRGDSVVAARSVPLGALHLTERFLRSDPPTEAEYEAMERHIHRTVSRALAALGTIEPAKTDLVASGGTPAVAAWMTRHKEPGTATGESIRIDELRALEQTCATLPVARRCNLPGLPADRADIIPAGLAVVAAFVDGAGKRVLRVNEGGVREGALIHLTRNNLKW